MSTNPNTDRMLELQEYRVALFEAQGKAIRIAHAFYALAICVAIIWGADEIATTLDEVCPTVEEGTTFLHARTT